MILRFGVFEIDLEHPTQHFDMAGWGGVCGEACPPSSYSGPKNGAETIPGTVPLQGHVTWQHWRPVAMAELGP